MDLVGPKTNHPEMPDEPKYPSVLNEDSLTVIINQKAHNFPKEHPYYKEAIDAHENEDEQTLESLSGMGKSWAKRQHEVNTDNVWHNRDKKKDKEE